MMMVYCGMLGVGEMGEIMCIDELFDSCTTSTKKRISNLIGYRLRRQKKGYRLATDWIWIASIKKGYRLATDWIWIA
jgi:hypothetical protein